MGAGAGTSWPLIAAILGSSALGSIFAPQGQKLQSFSGGGDAIDPKRLLDQAVGKTGQLESILRAELEAPVSVETRIPSLPGFAGGGLPFAIGAPAQDQAYVNPLVAKRSLHAFEGLAPPRPVPEPGPRPRPIPEPDPNDPPAPPDEQPPVSTTRTVPRQPPRQPLPGEEVPPAPDDVVTLPPHDDVSHALGAASLLLHSLTQPRRAA